MSSAQEKLLGAVESAAGEMTAARRRRDDAIRRAVAAGVNTIRVAERAGLTRRQIHRIVIAGE